MAAISIDTIHISGLSYSRLLNVEINKKMNDHSTAVITVEVSEDEKNGNVGAFQNDELVTVSTSAGGGQSVLFLGVKKSYVVTETAGYFEMVITLYSTSYKLDKVKVENTFQQSRKTVSTIIEEIAAGRAIIRFNVADRPAGFLIQCETDWKMIIRAASLLNACVIANTTTALPIIDIGMPQEGNAPITNNDLLANIPVGGLSYLDANKPYSLGVTNQFVNGTLETTIISGSANDFKIDKIKNESLSGKMLTGLVQDVRKAKVQVFFDQIDSEYDSGGDTWFEYAAAFAGEGGPYGSGIYFMPEIGDRVRVFFPCGDEGEGFAFASESSYVLDRDKYSWRAPGGQELLFTPDGIRISGKDNQVYIDMTFTGEEPGFTIVSDTNVQVVTTGEGSSITVKSKESMQLSADNQILLETPEATLEIDNDKIIMNAQNVYMKN